MSGKITRRLAVLFSAVLLAAAAGCGTLSETSNNHLTCWDFVQHLRQCGLSVDTYQQLDPSFVQAREGAAIKFKGVENEIGVYRYDIKREQDREKLKMYEQDQCMYVAGQKFAILINGSFIVFGHDKNPLKHQIMEAVESF